jgi:hypothetical protein
MESAMADPQSGDVQIDLAQAGDAPAGQPAPSAAAANRPPEAADVCVATAEHEAVGIDLFAHAHDPDGDSLQLVSTTQPVAGQVSLNPDGTVTFTPEQPGLQSFGYAIGDGQGGVATGDVSVFVNPLARELPQPVLPGFGIVTA